MGGGQRPIKGGADADEVELGAVAVVVAFEGAEQRQRSS